MRCVEFATSHLLRKPTQTPKRQSWPSSTFRDSDARRQRFTMVKTMAARARRSSQLIYFVCIREYFTTPWCVLYFVCKCFSYELLFELFPGAREHVVDKEDFLYLAFISLLSTLHVRCYQEYLNSLCTLGITDFHFHTLYCDNNGYVRRFTIVF